METPYTAMWGEYALSTDKARLQLDVVHGLLDRTYWAKGMPRETVARAVEGSLCFGCYVGSEQVAFGRAITDRATFAYLSDIVVADAHRGKGLGKWLVGRMLAHPDLQGMRRWLLVTADAQELYRKFGFEPLDAPERFLQRQWPDVYTRG